MFLSRWVDDDMQKIFLFICVFIVCFYYVQLFSATLLPLILPSVTINVIQMCRRLHSITQPNCVFHHVH